MAIYRVWGGGVPYNDPLLITADNSETAIKKAREVNKNCYITQMVSETNVDFNAGYKAGYMAGYSDAMVDKLYNEGGNK